jgi:hypothetical protein
MLIAQVVTRLVQQPSFERLMENLVRERVLAEINPTVVTTVPKEPMFNDQIQYKVATAAEDQFGKFRTRAAQTLGLVSVDAARDHLRSCLLSADCLQPIRKRFATAARPRRECGDRYRSRWNRALGNAVGRQIR